MIKNSLKMKAVVFAIVTIFIIVAFVPAISSTGDMNNKDQLIGLVSKNQPILSPKLIELKQKELQRPFNLETGWYWKPSYPNYAPSGMPDFDQKQDQWKCIIDGGNGFADTQKSGDDVQVVPVGNALIPGDVVVAPGLNCALDTVPAGDDKIIWSFCGPVAVANCFWWFDSKYADPSGTPGDGKDNFPLVANYGAGDDHVQGNVPLLIQKLARAMYTNTKGITYINDMQSAALVHNSPLAIASRTVL